MMAATQFDTIIRNGLVFDGSGTTPRREDIAITNGCIAARGPKLGGNAHHEVEAAGRWVMPGLLDIHTHLDLEVEVNPSLDE